MRKKYYTAIELLIKNARNDLSDIDYNIVEESLKELLKSLSKKKGK